MIFMEDMMIAPYNYVYGDIAISGKPTFKPQK